MAWKEAIKAKLATLKSHITSFEEDLEKAEDNFSGIEDMGADDIFDAGDNLRNTLADLYDEENIEDDTEEDDDLDEDEDE